ncbi:DNA damage-binding protein 2 [Chytridiales sp. JEL 0842]|nr:DNA damage-binding protein 2 [Chytridiales sp. JEL 0842]
MPARKRSRPLHAPEPQDDARDDDVEDEDQVDSTSEKEKLISNLRQSFQYNHDLGSSPTAELPHTPFELPASFTRKAKRKQPSTVDEDGGRDTLASAKKHQSTTMDVKGKRSELQSDNTTSIDLHTSIPGPHSVLYEPTSPHIPYPIQHHRTTTQFFKLPSQRLSTSSTFRPLSALGSLSNYWTQFRVSKTTTYFDRRVTAIEWHSDYERLPSVVAFASKGGDIVWYDHQKRGRFRGYVPEGTKEGDEEEGEEDVPFLYGKGAGGSITAMKFHPELPNMLYTTSIDGTVACKDFEGRHARVFLDTMNYQKWYTALAVPSKLNLLLVGSNTGQLILADRDGREVWTRRPDKSKIHDVEFHPTNLNLIVSAGTDRIAKIFDLRNMGRSFAESVDNESKALVEFHHEAPINSAGFSPMAPHALLTCSQDSKCNIYIDIPHLSPGKHLPACTFPHPHRQFQHLTSIRADWHPVVPNVFTIGRYPAAETPTDRRTIDVFSYIPGGLNGGVSLVSRIEDPRVSGIQALARFNYFGDAIASCSGFTSYVWEHKGMAFPKAGHVGGGDGDGKDDDDDDGGDDGEGSNGKKRKAKSTKGTTGMGRNSKGGADGKKAKTKGRKS